MSARAQRAGMALPAAVFLVMLLASSALAMAAFRDDVGKQAARLEARAALAAVLGSAATEAWWTIAHPGLTAGAAADASQLLVKLADPALAPADATESLPLPLTRSLAREHRGLTVAAAQVRIRQWTASGPVPQGLVEVTLTGRLDGVKLSIVELKRVWILPISGSVRGRVELSGPLAARRVEGV
jgi:hypothetical protein